MTTAQNLEATLGEFEGSSDVGSPQIPGSARASGDRLIVTASGHNMWLEQDEFHFVWKRVEGDWSITARPEFVGDGANAHRKAVVLVRQSLDADSPYAGLALHGDGLTSLQYRSEKAGGTSEVRFTAANGPLQISLARAGGHVRASADDAESHNVQLQLQGEYYIGLAVCSHVDDVAETVEFSDVRLEPILD